MSDSTDQTPGEILKALSAPFEAGEIKWKPGVISGSRCLALAYVNARVVQDRLDEVLGVAGWQDDYEFLEGGEVVCRLKVRVGGEWLTKVDVGGQSEQPDEGDRKKAAVSDALKRAAVKFGIGRYLYRLPSQWVDYDPQKKQLKPPQLPAFALPAPRQAKPNPAPVPEKPAAKEEPAPVADATMPKDGKELFSRIASFDARLAAAGRILAGELVKHVVQAGVAAGWDSDMTTWNDYRARLSAVDLAKAFAEEHTERVWVEGDVEKLTELKGPGKLATIETPRTPKTKDGKPAVKVGATVNEEQVRILQEWCEEKGVDPEAVAMSYADRKGNPRRTLAELSVEQWVDAVEKLKASEPAGAAAGAK